VDSGHSLKGPHARTELFLKAILRVQPLSETDKSEGVLGFGNSVSASVSKSIPAILGRNWDKNVKTFATCYSQTPQPAECTPPFYGFLDFKFLQQQLKVCGGLALFTLSLCLTLKVAFVLSLNTLYFLYKYSYIHKNNN
jgi:hypothetical protein